MFEVIIIIILLFWLYLDNAKDEIKKKKKIEDIEFLPLTKEELKKYRRYGDLVVLICFLCFILVSGIFFYFWVIIKNFFPANIIFTLFSLVAYIIFILLCFAPYIVWFYGKPLGIAYGKISKKKSVHIFGSLGFFHVYNICIDNTKKCFQI